MNHLRFIFLVSFFFLTQINSGAQSNNINRSSALPTVHTLTDSSYIPQLKRYRRIQVCLPTDYDLRTDKRYPVLYMMDGQNLFDSLTAFAGEWCIDESLKRMQRNGFEGCIVVAIDNDGRHRLDEYSAFRHPKYGGGEAPLFLQYITQQLKPEIDSVYRTQPGTAYTAIGGSSMGALFATYAMAQRPDVFGKGLIFSPSYWFSDSIYAFVKQAWMGIKGRQVMYMLGGEAEGAELIAGIKSMDSLLRTKGDNNIMRMIKLVPNGVHAEWFWRAEFEEGCRFIFQDISENEARGKKQMLELNTRMVPNPAQDIVKIYCWPGTSLEAVNEKGESVMEPSVTQDSPHQINVSQWPNGKYFIVFKSGNISYQKILEVLHP